MSTVKRSIFMFTIFFLSTWVFWGALAGKVFAEEPAVLEAMPETPSSYTGDLDEMLDLNRIRVLVAYSKTFYFLDGAEQRGLTYETFSEFEQLLNQKLQRKTIDMKLVFLPLKRDELIPALLDGYGDIVAANLTITPERQELVDLPSHT